MPWSVRRRSLSAASCTPCSRLACSYRWSLLSAADRCHEGVQVRQARPGVVEQRMQCIACHVLYSGSGCAQGVRVPYRLLPGSPGHPWVSRHSSRHPREGHAPAWHCTLAATITPIDKSGPAQKDGQGCALDGQGCSLDRQGCPLEGQGCLLEGQGCLLEGQGCLLEGVDES